VELTGVAKVATGVVEAGWLIATVAPLPMPVAHVLVAHVPVEQVPVEQVLLVQVLQGAAHLGASQTGTWVGTHLKDSHFVVSTRL